MERIHKIPFISGCSAAIATGIVSYAAHTESRIIYMRMAVMMLVFFIIGLYVKNTILSIQKEMQYKKQEQKRAEKEQLFNEAEEKKASASAHKLGQQGHKPEQQGQMQGIQAHKLDLAAEDTEDDFKPLVMSKAVSSKLKE
jgi:uncharacterized membrane protein YcjF (UPF0283 family)